MIQTKEDCLFCKIVSRQEPADIVLENDNFVVVKNKYPNAPIHLLIIAKEHIVKQDSLTNNFSLWEGFFKTHAEVVKLLNLNEDYQLVVNAPKRAHFHHEHMHIVSGRDLFEK